MTEKNERVKVCVEEYTELGFFQGKGSWGQGKCKDCGSDKLFVEVMNKDFPPFHNGDVMLVCAECQGFDPIDLCYYEEGKSIIDGQVKLLSSKKR